METYINLPSGKPEIPRDRVFLLKTVCLDSLGHRQLAEKASQEDWHKACDTITEDKVKWAVSLFARFKGPWPRSNSLAQFL